MFDNRPSETQYFYTDNDFQGSQLDGRNLYAVTFAEGKMPPFKGFWSMTIYNKYHIFELYDLNRYSLGTKNQDLKFNPDGSRTAPTIGCGRGVQQSTKNGKSKTENCRQLKD